MKNLFLAKSNPKETIIEHTENLLSEFENIKEIYKDLDVNWELLRLACLYHDLGKMNTKFQNKIINNINKDNEVKIEELKDDLKEVEEIPHGYLSGAFISNDKLKEKFSEDEIKIFYESIFYHHNREKLEGDRRLDLKKVIEEDLPKYLNDFKYGKLLDDELSLNSNFRKYLRKRTLEEKYLISKNEKEKNIARKFIMTKGLLNKIDYAASSGVKIEVTPGNLRELTEKSISKYGLNKLQEFMKEHENNNLIIKASTGIGKTEGALIWIGNNKGFFTLPLRVSINSIYDRVINKSKIGYQKEKTALLHSDSASEYMKREVDGIIDKTYLDLTKQLSMPLTICTLDQLIGFVFKCEGFELKLATLSYSKLVIDEIQMYSPDMVAYLILALRDITLMGGKFAIVTATFPPIFEYFMNYVSLKNERDYLKAEEPFLKEVNGEVMLRHKLKIFEKNIDSKIIHENFKGQKILVIVNTVKLAQKLYDELKLYDDIKDKIYLFHSRFIKEERSIKEDAIFKDGQLENKFSGIWITTQVVEASLDIDFDVLYTELSDASGLLQRMGRVYRNRLLDSKKENVNVFIGDINRPSGVSQNSSIIDIDIFDKSKEVIKRYNNMELDEMEKMKIVDEVYSVENLKDSDYFYKIKHIINEFNNLTPYTIKKDEARLRDILSETIIPKKVYDYHKEYINYLISKLNSEKDFSKKIAIRDELMKKTLSIPSRKFEIAKNKGACIEELPISKFEKLYIFPCEYSFNKGLEYLKDYNNFDDSQFL